MRDPISRRATTLRGRALNYMVLLVTLGIMAEAVATEPREHLHFTVNLRSDYASAASVGFNLVDVGTQSALRALPEGMKGVYWLGNGYNLSCSWRLSDRLIIRTGLGSKGHPKCRSIN